MVENSIRSLDINQEKCPGSESIGGNCPEGNFMGEIVQEELFSGNCPGGKSLGSNCPGGNFMGVNCPGSSCPGSNVWIWIPIDLNGIFCQTDVLINFSIPLRQDEAITWENFIPPKQDPGSTIEVYCLAGMKLFTCNRRYDL